ncbi:MAG TPA: hypothetical protein EYP77_11150, partial [Anaerolineae bacterium]|nr:hypothetical protein [Anaerolineae bacterium]
MTSQRSETPRRFWWAAGVAAAVVAFLLYLRTLHPGVGPYLDFLLRQYRLADAFWFLAVEETFGTEAAVKL